MLYLYYLKIKQHLLDREEIWNKWKNEGCPNYVKEKKQVPVKQATKRQRPISTDFVLNNNKTFVSDNSEMSKLCMVNHGKHFMEKMLFKQNLI